MSVAVQTWLNHTLREKQALWQHLQDREGDADGDAEGILQALHALVPEPMFLEIWLIWDPEKHPLLQNSSTSRWNTKENFKNIKSVILWFIYLKKFLIHPFKNVYIFVCGLFKKYFYHLTFLLYLFIFACTGSSVLCTGFL